MLKRILLPTIFLILAYGFWISPDIKEIAAGVAIFLFGMLSLEQGFKAFTGGVLERILRRTTDRYWKSLSFGVVSTTIMQSSSLVSVITISFLSAGLLGLAAGIGIIFGANLGTTTGAWLIAGLGLKVKISAYAMPMLVFGVILIFQRSKTLRGIGYILTGLGFLFLGIHHMKVGFEAFKSTIDLTEFAVSGYAGLFLFTGIGVFATVVMQSSHATLVLIITALAAGQITYENALALAIGANVGTTITAIIGAMSANYQGKQLAAAHLLFNLATGVIAIAFITQFLAGVEYVSSALGIREDDYTLKLAVFHTLFNSVGIIVMSPFIGRMVTLLQGLIRPKKEEGVVTPRHLNDAAIDFADTAVEAIKQETHFMYRNAVQIILHTLSLHRQDVFSDKPLEEVVAGSRTVMDLDVDMIYSKRIKGLYGAIIDFIGRAEVSSGLEQSEQIHWLRTANRAIINAVKDSKHLRKNMVRFITSENEAIRDEYDRLRLQIAVLMRELYHHRPGGEEVGSLLDLDALKLMIEESHEELNSRLVRHIQQGDITPHMATSLLNDSSYAYDISANLLSMGETLVSLDAYEDADLERQVALDEVELATIAGEGRES